MEFALGISVNSWSSVCAIAKKAVQYGRSVSQPVSELSLSINRIAHRFWWCCCCCCRRSINQLSPLSCPTFSCCCSFCCLSFLGLAEEIAPAFSVAIWAQLVSQSVSQSFKSSSLNLPNTPLPQPQHTMGMKWSPKKGRRSRRSFSYSPSCRQSKQSKEKNDQKRRRGDSPKHPTESSIAVGGGGCSCPASTRVTQRASSALFIHSFSQSVSEMERFNGLCLLSQSIVSLVRLAVYRVLCVCHSSSSSFPISISTTTHKPLWTKVKK